MKQRTPFDAADELLRLAISKIQYFEEHPPHLAWLMMHYAALNDRGQVLTDGYENPKDTILSLSEGLPKAQAALLYDAWGITVSNHFEFPDAHLKLEFKAYKTMDDWLQLKLNPRYRYRSIYPDRRAVYDHLLCAIGNGMNWVKNDKDQLWYIADVGPSGINDAIFAGYTKAEKRVAPDIRRKVNQISKGFGCSRLIRTKVENNQKVACGWEWDVLTGKLVPRRRTFHARIMRKQTDEGFILRSQELLEKYSRKYYPMAKEYSLFCTIPEQAHPSYWEAGIRAAVEILSNRSERQENRPLARQFLARTKYAKTKLGDILQDMESREMSQQRSEEFKPGSNRSH